MPTSRRTVLAAAGAGLSFEIAQAAGGSGRRREVAELTAISERSNDALMRGGIIK